MSEAMKLAASVRDRGGKGASRAVRLTGRVPAVIYGNKSTPTMIHVPLKELTKLLSGGHFMNSVVEVDVDGTVERTLPRDVQFHPVSDRPIHVDFLRLAAGSAITVAVPVHFIDEDKSPGMKRGGALNIVRHEIELSCPSDAIPDQIDISLAGLDIGDSVHISAVKLPEGVTSVITDRDFTIVTMVAPSALQSADAAADEATAAAAAAESSAASTAAKA
ncbi:MAG: 50S ribosomal protein L25/general stress protein Ctc [Sphingomonadaceae bacterium]|nr:50S ribosomal protein L25/general stress protein Ctc [Sphingomonadaceae bacterium]